MKRQMTKYEINEKVEYSAGLRVHWRGLCVCRSRMYCHGFIKAVRRGLFGVLYVIKDAKSERVDCVSARHVYGKAGKKSLVE